MEAEPRQTNTANLGLWLQAVRAPFLIHSLVLGILGTAVARYDGYFNPGFGVLGCLGLILMHASVNAFNNYFDYKSGIDAATHPTPFSGGIKIITGGLLKPGTVLGIAIGCFAVNIPIGVYFLLKVGWGLLPVLLAGGFIVLLYTQWLARLGVGELAAGLGLGFLPVLGLYFIQTGMYAPAAAWVAVIPGILTFNLLFLNEFPDAEADRRGGRRHLVILWGHGTCAWLYAALSALIYLWLIAGVSFKLMPAWTLLGLLTLPFAVKAVRGGFQHRDLSKLVPALAANVAVVILTQLLLAAGYILAKP